MGDKVLEFIIRAKDATSKGLNRVRQNFQGLSSKVRSSIKGMMSSMAGLVGVSVSVGAAIAGLGKTIKAAFEFERYETQFKVLFGDLEKAKSHIKELQKFSAETPFQFGDIAQASRQLNILTGGVMGSTESLKLVGDAAAATGANMGELSMWVGRAYGAIKAGRPFGEAAMRLMELGVLTPEVRGEMEKLQASGASNAEVWGKLQQALEKYEGGMEEMSKTGEGLFSTLKDNWNLALAEFGKQFEGVAKDQITALIDKLKQLKEDGTLREWAENAKAMLGKVVDAIVKINEAIDKHRSKNSAVTSLQEQGKIGGFDSFMLRAPGMMNVVNWAADLKPDSHAGRIKSMINDEQTKKEQADTAKKAASKEASQKASAEKEKTLQQKIADDLAVAQKKVDEANYAKWLKDQESIWEKADKAAKKATDKQIKNMKREKARLEKAAVRGQLEGNAVDLAQQRGILRDAQNRMQAANNAVDQAWGWVADPKAFKDQLKREKEQAKLERKFEQDAARIQGMADWRTRNLGAKDEAVRRMMLAKEEQKAAQNQLQQIERHVANLQAIRQDLQKNLRAAGG